MRGPRASRGHCYQWSIEMLTADDTGPSSETMEHGQCDAIAQTQSVIERKRGRERGREIEREQVNAHLP